MSLTATGNSGPSSLAAIEMLSSCHLPCHTAYHSNFFVLRLDVHLNRAPVKLKLSSDGQLEVCGTQGGALPMESVVG